MEKIPQTGGMRLQLAYLQMLGITQEDIETSASGFEGFLKERRARWLK